ncbi:integrase/recombinase xerD homolog [Eublepharis macularius]|uniref:Integrase/recombinase xerD homolog n=1 Tax=Eublepharis macularius TaxID=481883 RepID=A0AA97JSK4_EUBMA|nr:integrase/recombinase xerD homolog [Eublepharis macularius]
MQGILNSVAPSTLRSYTKAVARFLAFAEGLDVPVPWPASQATVLQYLAHLHGLGLAAGTMRRDLAAISFFSKAGGFPDPCDSFEARRAMEGWGRVSPRVPDQRRPITLPVLRAILREVPDVCWSSFEAQLLHTTFVLAFFGAFRVGELVAGSRRDPSGRALALGDVAPSRRRVAITIRHSKTDQQGRGASVLLRSAREKAICPVRAVWSFLAVRPHSPGPFLIHRDGSPLTRYQFAALLRACLQAAGFPPEEFATHSFRIGAATVASVLGLPPAAIQRLGRWRSSAFRSYIRTARALTC